MQSFCHTDCIPVLTGVQVLKNHVLKGHTTCILDCQFTDIAWHWFSHHSDEVQCAALITWLAYKVVWSYINTFKDIFCKNFIQTFCMSASSPTFGINGGRSRQQLGNVLGAASPEMSLIMTILRDLGPSLELNCIQNLHWTVHPLFISTHPHTIVGSLFTIHYMTWTNIWSNCVFISTNTNGGYPSTWAIASKEASKQQTNHVVIEINTGNNHETQDQD